jgi:predicted MFS family arabinose efflux permease
VAAGVFVSTMGPAGGKLVLVAFPPARRGFAMGLRQTGIPIGGLVAAALLPWLAATWGWRTSLLVAGVFTCAGAAIVFSLVGLDLREEREAIRAMATGEHRAVLVRDRDIMLITLWGAMLVGGQHALLAFLALDLHQAASLSLPVAASLLIVAQAGGILGRIGWGLASDRLLDGRRRPLLLVITALALVAALALVVLPGRASLALLAVVALVAGLSLIGYQGLWLTTVAELGGPSRAGEVMGFGLMFIAVAAVLSTPLYGLVADLAGDFSAIWVALAGVLAVAFVPAALLRERGREAV